MVDFELSFTGWKFRARYVSGHDNNITFYSEQRSTELNCNDLWELFTGMILDKVSRQRLRHKQSHSAVLTHNALTFLYIRPRGRVSGETLQADLIITPFAIDTCEDAILRADIQEQRIT